MTTNNSVGVSLSGASGTGNFAGTNSPIFITPTLGDATADSLAFSPTTKGIVGTTAANNAGAGYVGEYITSNIMVDSAVTLTNVTAADITSISLTAGDWDVFGNISFISNSSTLATSFTGWISLTSATFPDQSLVSYIAGNTYTGGTDLAGFVVPFVRVSISTTTNIYLSCISGFSVSTMAACGTISARRVR